MIDYNKPHQVMLFFEQKQLHDDEKSTGCIQEQISYYQGLKSLGKVAISGDLYNQGRLFVILSVDCDGELNEIISNDPALQEEICDLVRAMPFVAV